MPNQEFLNTTVSLAVKDLLEIMHGLSNTQDVMDSNQPQNEHTVD